MGFRWNEQKNAWLKNERHMSFERIVAAIEEGHLIGVLEHPNKEKYADQLILIVEIGQYAFCVPCVKEKNGDYFLITLYPNRKYTRFFNLGGKL